LTSGTAWDAAIAAFKACSVTDASYVVARGQNGQVTVYWSSPNWVTVLRKTSANGVFTTETPTAPGTATTQYSGAAGSLTESVANGTWYYKVFTKCGATYSAGIAITPVPATTSLWSYSTAAATLAPPGIDDNNVVIWGGNDNKVHGADANTGVMKFPVFTQPTGALQARPPIIPAAYSQTGVNVAYATSQDGNVYAINTATGAQLWKKSLTAANKLQGGAAVWLQSIQSLPICGATTDAVFVGTRDTATTTGNIIYALNAGTSQATTTAAGGTCVAGTVNPGDVLWTFTGNATFKLDAIVSTPYVDYTTYAGNKYALWVTSNAASGLLQPSLWKLNVQNGTLFSGNTTSCTTPATSCWLLGHTDASPSPSGDGSWMYVGTNCIGSSCATQAATFNAVEISSGSVKTHNPGTGGFNGTGNIRGPYPLTSAPFGTQGTIAYVNSQSTAQSTASTSCVVDMASASPSGGLTAGNTNIVIVAVPVAAEKVWNITDSRGSIYSRRNYFFAAGLVVEIWSGVVAAGNGATVTVSFNAYSTTSVCAVAQYSGVGAVVSKPSFNNATGSGTTATVATFAPTQDTNNWAVAGFAYVANSAFTSGTGNLRTSATFASVGAALTDNSSASKATVTNAVNHSATGTWVATVVELRSVTVDHVIFTRDATVHGMQFAGNASGTSSTTFNRSYDVSPGFVSAVVDDGGGRMYVGQTNGKLLQMDAWAGSGVWWDTNLHPSPQIAGTSVTLGDPSYDGVLSRIYVGGNDGRVYAVTVPW
jgi:outer membrane protein assembly factor BamB